MRVLVTGGAGFIGSHLAGALGDAGHSVTVIDNLSSGKIENLPEDVRFIRGDIRDPGACHKSSEEAECVFHLAALKSVPGSLNNPAEYNAVNINGTLNMLEAARAAGARRFVFASSSAVYGGSSGCPQRESDPAVPLSPYALTKLAGENYMKVYSENFGLDTVSLRYFNVFGPGQTLDDEYAVVIPKFIDRISKGEAPPVFGSGLQVRDFTYIDNVVSSNILALSADKPLKGEAVNIATGKSRSILELARSLSKIIGIRAEPEFLPPRPGDIFRSEADTSKALEMLGFRPFTGFEEGLEKTVVWFLKDIGEVCNARRADGA